MSEPNTNKVVYVTFALICTADADLDDVVSDLDYTFYHPEIIETELRDARKLEG
jgi:hypothetical protein